MSVTPFASLTPDSMLDALESVGLSPDGRLLALNSYENRVYQVFMEESAPLVVKFYRAARWPDAAILEEHEFSSELAARELPVIAPMVFNGQTLLKHGDLRFAVFTRPVSYTHLDVYKRQWQTSARGCRASLCATDRSF